jgi:hypothetical protein
MSYACPSVALRVGGSWCVGACVVCGSGNEHVYADCRQAGAEAQGTQGCAENSKMISGSLAPVVTLIIGMPTSTAQPTTNAIN